ncbi:MAG TPA: response regulator, partial [Desulfobacter postgatei]|nr:response regulator [Desulfobacter postgatei]
HLLFVDDEDMILKVAKSMLDRLGYLSTTMRDPLAALAGFKKEPFKYELVITDLYMPHMNGNCLAENIKEIRPDIPILLCTGFSDDITLDMMAQTGISDVLSKPLSIKELSDKIGKFLKPKMSII